MVANTIIRLIIIFWFGFITVQYRYILVPTNYDFHIHIIAKYIFSNLAVIIHYCRVLYSFFLYDFFKVTFCLTKIMCMFKHCNFSSD